jgi:hypothetical protein
MRKSAMEMKQAAGRQPLAAFGLLQQAVHGFDESVAAVVGHARVALVWSMPTICPPAKLSRLRAWQT